MSLTPIDQIAAAYCGSKRQYPDQETAETVAARHYACRICVGGDVELSAYRCTADPSHWHAGHLGVRR